MRVILTLIASSLLVTAAWAAARFEAPTGLPDSMGAGGSGVAGSLYEPFGEEVRAATGSTGVGHTHAATTGGGMTGTGSTATGGGM